MGSIARAEKRREIKKLRKELGFLRKHTDFNELMQSHDIADASKEDQLLLQKEEHPDPLLQSRYTRAMKLLMEVLKRESRLIELTTKQDLPDVEE
jgi:hypothetical protein